MHVGAGTVRTAGPTSTGNPRIGFTPSHEVTEGHELRIGGVESVFLSNICEDPCEDLVAHLHLLSFSCAVSKRRPSYSASGR